MSPLPRTKILALLSTVLACTGDPIEADPACRGGLLPGDLVISEVFADPMGADAGKEWFELYNATDAPLQLAGLWLTRSKPDGTAAKQHLLGELDVDPQGYVVLGAMDDELRAAFVDYGFGDALGDLPNAAGLLTLGCDAGTPLDTVQWIDASEDTARGFDGARTPDALANDDPSAWCDATTSYATDQHGTPGAPNDACASTGVPATCAEDGALRSVVAPRLGDIVISEVHADPQAVDDADGEWFEIYVAADLDLNGLVYGRSSDLPQGQITGVECVHVEAGSHVVVAHVDDAERNGGLPELIGVFERALANSEGALVLSYGDEQLDAITWTRSEAGVASSLDPRYLDVLGNDDPAHSCAATTPYGAGDLGTPGAANDVACSIAPPAGYCFDGSAFVEVIAPRPGELVITEVHADPDAVADADGEWFELRATAPVHLNGLELGVVPGEPKAVLEAPDCIALAAGELAVLAREAAPDTNGGLPRVHATFDFALTNAAASLYVASDGQVVDEVAWSSSSTGAASSLDPAFLHDNDDERHWCPATAVYGDGDLGTPGTDNPPCTSEPPGGCRDGDLRRDIAAPLPGELVITELMADPAAAADADGEWFELLVLADVDLHGLQLFRVDDTGTASLEQTIGDDACLAVAAGTRLLFARSDAHDVNGGLPEVDVMFDFALVNEGGGIAVGIDDVVLDAVQWSHATAGVSRSLDPAHRDPLDDDDDAAWCASTTTYGDGDRGTPGAANDAC